MGLFKTKNSNQDRLNKILEKINPSDAPEGWQKVTLAAIGGLTDLGFSKHGPFLLIISSQGRGVFDCNTGEKVARDNQDIGPWVNEQYLTCKGIGPIESEIIQTCGIHGGGLPHTNNFGESIEVVAPEWPIYDLYFCRNRCSALSNGNSSNCWKIDSEYLRAFGFSWCGKFLVSATSSEFTLWKRL